jgi:hypothetical protein
MDLIKKLKKSRKNSSKRKLNKKNNKLHTKIIKITKSEKKNKNNILVGGNRYASNIDVFISLINSEDMLPIEENKLEDLSNLGFNTYYNTLIQYLPCGNIIRGINSVKEYKFDINFKYLPEQTTEKEIYVDESFHGADDYCIVEQLNNDDGYRIIFNFDNINMCENIVQLITMRLQTNLIGHAMVLLFNTNNLYLQDNNKNKKKTFTVIDPNGFNGTIVGNLNDTKVIEMLQQILQEKDKTINHEQIVIPPCQTKSFSYKGSCLLWSQLYCELFLRFGLTETQEYLKKFYDESLITSIFIKKYASYIVKSIDDNSYIIMDPNYDEALKLSKLISFINNEVVRNHNIFTERNRNTIPVLYPINNVLSIIFCYNYAEWIFLFAKKNTLGNIYNKNKFVVKSSNSNKTQLLSTFIKNYNEVYYRLKAALETIKNKYNEAANKKNCELSGDGENKSFFISTFEYSDQLVTDFFPKKGYIR